MSRTLTPKTGRSGVKLVSANVSEVTTRSNIVHHKMNVTKQLAAMRSSHQLMSDYLLLKYRNELVTFGRSREDRMRAINKVLDFELQYISELEHVQEFCDLVTEDIDQNSYALQRLNILFEAMTPNANRERRM